MNMQVEVAYATPTRQALIEITMPEGATIKEAILTSGILDSFKTIELAHTEVGIFGKIASLDTTLKAGDRVEIYRPLVTDPKENRRLRARKAKRPKSF